MKILRILAAWLLLCGPVLAQAQIGAGQVWGNSTAARTAGKSETVTAILDRAFGSTRGAILERGASGWALLSPSATARVPYLSGGTGADPLFGAFTLPASVTSGGVACYTSTTAQGTSVLLTANAIIVGGGAGACPAPLASLGTTTTVLHGNAGGPPSFGSVALGSDVSGQLPIGNGGTGAASAAAAISALMPTPTRAGDVAYWNGSNWVTLAGNNSGTQVLTENASGVPSWALPGSGTVTTAGLGMSLTGGGSTLGLTKLPYIKFSTTTFVTDATSTTSTTYKYIVTGGGGGGGGTNAASATGGGGGAGGTCIGTFTGVAAGVTVTISLGAGGAAGGTAGTNGGAGVGSNISGTGFTTVSAIGGGIGGGSTTTVGSNGSGGICAVGSGVNGGSGTFGSAGTAGTLLGGAGGASYWGGGGRGGNPAQAATGETAVAPGGGGGGSTGSAAAGGAGAPGAATIEWISIQ